jgi:hypothetical protein
LAIHTIILYFLAHFEKSEPISAVWLANWLVAGWWLAEELGRDRDFGFLQSNLMLWRVFHYKNFGPGPPLGTGILWAKNLYE